MTKINANTRWNQNGITVAGGNGVGAGLNQLNYPWGLYIDDDDQTVYIADKNNHRIVEWKCGATSGQVVAGENGSGNQNGQLNCPRDVIVDKERSSLIISDSGNYRVMRWPGRNGIGGQTLISNVNCHGIAMDDDGYLYVPDCDEHDVKRWGIGVTSGIVVAGGNGVGNRLDQLSGLVYIFVDQECSVYVADEDNHRVMKWMKGAKEGIVVAGGQGEGNSLSQLYRPRGVTVDQLGTVYVADNGNNRIMRWIKGAKQGSLVIGGNGQGKQTNQLYYPQDLSFDRQGNLYVVDGDNHRVQRFDII
jgi:sugar lactone lactonase YvrE